MSQFFASRGQSIGASASASVRLSGECITSLILSHHNKKLKRRTLKPSACHNSRTVLQLHVTAQFYLENKGKYILEVHTDPKDTKKRERKRAPAHTRVGGGMGGETPLALWFLFLCFFLPLGLPYVNWATQECCLEKAMAPHSSTLAWKIPWMEEPNRLLSMGSLRVRQD